MHKVRDNYLAEVIILLTSCGSTNNCPAYASIECENCDEVD